MKLDVDYSPEPAVSERDPGRDRDVHRSGHRREFDARQPRRSLSDRVEGVVRDVGMFRAVALADIVNRQFDGHPFAARQGIAQAEQRGWIVREQAQGPTGRPYTVLVATPAGAARAAVLFASAGRADQRVHSGAVKAADLRTRSPCIAPRARRRRGSRRRAGASPGSGSMPNSRGRWPHGRSGRGRRQAGRRQRRQSGVRDLQVMRPWRVAVGLTMTGGALAVWALWLELSYLRPYWPVLLADYRWYIGAHSGLALVTLGVGVYIAARSVSLGAVGRKVDVVEQAIRRGTGQNPELAEALARDESGDYREGA